MCNDPKLSQSAYQMLADLRYQIRKFIRFSEDAARSAGVQPQQHQLMLAIKGYPDREFATPSELAERLQIKHNACLGLIGRCEQLGLVRRAPNPLDHRSVVISLTEKAERLLEQLSRMHLEELRRAGRWLRDLEL